MVAGLGAVESLGERVDRSGRLFGRVGGVAVFVVLRRSGCCCRLFGAVALLPRTRALLLLRIGLDQRLPPPRKLLLPQFFVGRRCGKV